MGYNYYSEIYYGTSFYGYNDQRVYIAEAYQNSPDNLIIYWGLFPYAKSMLTRYNLIWEIEFDYEENFNSPNYFKLVINNDPNNGYIIEPNAQSVRGIRLSIEDFDILKNSIYNNKRIFIRIGVRDFIHNQRAKTSIILLQEKVTEIKNLFYSSNNNLVFDLPKIITKNEYYEYVEEKKYHKLVDVLLYPLRGFSYYFQKLEKGLKRENIPDEYISFFAKYIGLERGNMSFLDYREIVLSFLNIVKNIGTYESVIKFLERIYKTNVEIYMMSKAFFIFTTDDEYIHYLIDENDLNNNVRMSEYYYIDSALNDYGFKVRIYNPFLEPNKINFEAIKRIARNIFPAHLNVSFEEIMV